MITEQNGIVSFVARDIAEAWYFALLAAYEHGRNYLVGKGSYENDQFRREINGVLVFTIKDPTHRPFTTHEMPVTEEYVTVDYPPYLLSSDIAEGEQYTYGSRAAPYYYNVADMLQGVIDSAGLVAEELDNESVIWAGFPPPAMSTNQSIVEIAKPSDCELEHPPCMRSIQFRLVTGQSPLRLDLIVNFRSWDLYGGLPGNLAILAQLMEYMCSLLNSPVNPGRIIATSAGAHYYSMYDSSVAGLLKKDKGVFGIMPKEVGGL